MNIALTLIASLTSFSLVIWATHDAIAQVSPAPDGTGTQVNTQGDRIDIEGGSLSGDGRNLFHSFDEFGLSESQIANFLSNPDIQNILSRVVGGNASVIEGLIRVTGGDSNLYLMNPAGVIFGPNARLDVPGSFTATTATGIGFGDRWFSAFSPNDYQTLVGEPTAFAFDLIQPGAILNAGELEVDANESLTLLGGTVINTGTLSAPDGTITIAAIEGENLVRISQDGALLSLELETREAEQQNGGFGASVPFTPLQLPELLTGSGLGNADRVTANPDGTISIIGSGLRIEPTSGTVVVSGTIDASSFSTSSPFPLRFPDINVLGDRIGLIDATLDASSTRGGGTIRIGGDYRGSGEGREAHIGSPRYAISSTFNAERTYIDSATTIRADGHNPAIANDSAHTSPGGTIIVWADDTTQFYGTATARGGEGGGDGGFVEISGRDHLDFDGVVDLSAPLGETGTLLLDPDNIVIINGEDALNDAQIEDGQIFQAEGLGTDFTLSELALEAIAADANVILEATDSITIEDLFDNELTFAAGPGGSITFRADADADNVGIFTMNSGDTIRAEGRDLSISAASITAGTLDTSLFSSSENRNGGTIELTATSGNILVDGSISAIARDAVLFDPSAPNLNAGDGGSITLNAMGGSIGVGGSIEAQSLASDRVSGDGGMISLVATDDISIGGGISAETSGPRGSGDGGAITLTADNGDIAIDSPIVSSSSSGNGGAIALTANGGSILIDELIASGATGGDIVLDALRTIRTGAIFTSGALGDGGDVLIDPRRNVRVDLIDAQGGPEGSGGTVDITTRRFFRAIDTFVDQNGLTASISTAGGIAGGDITIRHSGARRNTPFIVGDAEVNGTAGDLTSGTAILPSNPQHVFEDSVSEGDSPGRIRIITGLVDRTNSDGDPEPIVTLREEVCPPFCDDQAEDGVEDNEVNPEDSNVPPAGVQRDVVLTLNQTRNIMQTIEQAIGAKPALIYVGFVPTGTSLSPGYTQRESAATEEIQNYLEQDKTETDLTFSFQPQGSDRLELILVTEEGEVIRKPIRDVTRDEVLRVSRRFTSQISDRRRTSSTGYLSSAQQLYDWLIAPIEADLQAQEIDNIAFVMDAGLRSLPVAALHDGNQFLIERYSVGMMPSLSLVDTRYTDLRGAQVLAMGASDFVDQPSLPAVPIELDTISDLWTTDVYLNTDFTLSNLKTEQQENPFGIVHLATHAEFRPGIPDNSYIQFSDRRLRLDQLRELGLNNPPVDLLVLSACQTALGNEDAELGFAGLALQAGVKSALASLWLVSDAGTLGFMSEFYRQLRATPIKADALRQAQIAMLRGDVRIEDGQLRTTRGDAVPLPETNRDGLSGDLSHPFYWSAFTMIGSPW